MPDKHEVGGSSPLGPTKSGGVAQLGEHLPCKQGVMGSNPIISTKENEGSEILHRSKPCACEAVH